MTSVSEDPCLRWPLHLSVGGAWGGCAPGGGRGQLGIAWASGKPEGWVEPVACYPSGGPDLPRPAWSRMKEHRALGSIQTHLSDSQTRWPTAPRPRPVSGPLALPTRSSSHAPGGVGLARLVCSRCLSRSSALGLPAGSLQRRLWERTAPASPGRCGAATARSRLPGRVEGGTVSAGLPGRLGSSFTLGAHGAVPHIL